MKADSSLVRRTDLARSGVVSACRWRSCAIMRITAVSLLCLVVASVVDAQSSVEPPPDIVSWWPGDGDANDIVGSNHGTLLGGATLGEGWVDQAFTLDGLDDYVDFGDPIVDGFSAITIEAWIKRGAKTSQQTIAGIHRYQALGPGSNADDIGFYYKDDQARFSISTTPSGRRVIGSGPNGLPEGEWTHLAGTYDGAQMKLYRNGVLVAEDKHSGELQATFSFRMGYEHSLEQLYFHGSVDELTVYDRSLAASEITGLFKAGSGGKKKPGPNDECANATAVSEGSFDFDTSHAAGPDVDQPCSGGEDADVWFLYTASATGTLTASTCNSVGGTQDTILSVYDRDRCLPGSGSALGCNDDAGCGATGFLSELSVNVVGGNRYLVQVSSFTGDPGPGTLDLILASTECVEPPVGIVSWWPGDGGAEDLVGGNHGTSVNGATLDTGLVGQAFSLDGVDDYVDMGSPTVDVPSGITIACWVKRGATTALQAIAGVQQFQNQTATANDIGLYFNNDAVVFSISTTPDGRHGVSSRPDGLPEGEWVHVAGTYDGASMMNLYRNGVVVADDGWSGALQATASFRIGAPHGWNDFYFDGLVDELTVYDRALEASEIQAIFAAGSLGKCRPAPEPPSIQTCTWSGLGGVRGPVLALASYDDGNGPQLYAAGMFGGSIQTLNPLNELWESVGGGTDGDVNVLTVFAGELYAGGAFSQAGTVPASRIARWDGTNWSPLGTGLNDSVQALAAFDAELYTSGHFTLAGGTAVNSIARWDGTIWSPVGTGLDDSAQAMVIFDGALYVGGPFTSAGGVPGTSRIAKWDGSQWSSVGGGLVHNNVTSLAVFDDGNGDALYAATVNPNGVEKWDGSGWSVVGTTDFPPLALAVMSITEGEGLYVGGDLTNVNGVPVNYVARWDGTSWTGLQTGFDSRLNALHAFNDGRGVALYAGGLFSTAGGVEAPFTAKWRCACCGDAAWALSATTGPSARDRFAMTFDGARSQVVLFGGSDTSGLRGDTWVWENGVRWSQALSAGPGPRFDHAMTYDDTRARTVLFGGRDGIGLRGDTWEWDGGAWLEVVAPGPSARERHAMAYDRGRSRVVLFGGSDGGGLRGDTWEWDGISWSQVASFGPSPREESAIVYDEIRSRIVLFGGFNGAYLGDTWEWDGATWTQVATTGPSSRSEHGMTHLPACGHTLLFGGVGAGGRNGETWEWDGTTWSQTAATGPSARGGHSLAYDSLRRRATLFGGHGQKEVAGDTWEWGCPCEDEIPAALDENGDVVFPVEWDPNEPVLFEDVDYVAGAVTDLYDIPDPPTDDWYANGPCDWSIGGTVPEEAANPDVQSELAAIHPDLNVSPDVIAAQLSAWGADIAAAESALPDPILTANPLPGGYVPPQKPHCKVAGRDYLFGGRDIVFVHGLDTEPLVDKLAGVPGALTTWPLDAHEFEGTGYWKKRAECKWEHPFKRQLEDPGFSNRYLVVAWPATQRLAVGVQAVLAQIDRAMRTGFGVVDPLHPGFQPTNFGTPSYIIVSQSTGTLVTDVAMSSAAILNVPHVADFAKGHIASHGAFSGSTLATAAVAAASAAPSLPPWVCPMVKIYLASLGTPVPLLDCSNPPFLDSVLIDLVPQVAQNLWGSYLDTMPVPTVTIVGGHPTKRKPFKYFLFPGFDDGVNTINSAVANPNPKAFWPSAFAPTKKRRIFDMGIDLDRAIGFYRDQSEGPLAAGGATPWLSPTGMVQPVLGTFGYPLNPLNRYGNHFSFIQGAAFHRSVNPDCNEPPSPPYPPPPPPDNEEFEETRVITDPAVYQGYSTPPTASLAQYPPYVSQYPDVLVWNSLLTPSSVPKIHEVVKGLKVEFTINLGFIKIPVRFWIWKRHYHRLNDWDQKQDLDYAFESVLTEGGPDLCPPVSWPFSGKAHGGTITITFQGPTQICTVTIITTGSEPAATVAANLAAAVNSSACCIAEGITAMAAESKVIFEGITMDDIIVAEINDPGLEHPDMGTTNNDCFEPIQLHPGFALSFDTTDTTTDGSSPCGNVGADIWYVFTAPSNGTLRVDTCGSGFDTALAVYGPDVTCPPVVSDALACNDDCVGGGACGSTSQSCVEITVESGAQYRIQIGGSSGSQGAGTLSAEFIPEVGPPPNDECTGAIQANAGTFPFDTTSATTDGPTPCGEVGSDIWYVFDAPSDGTLAVSTCGSSFDTVLTVFGPDPSCPPDLNDTLACNDDCESGGLCEFSLQSCLEVAVEPGGIYQIQVGGYGGGGGGGTVDIQFNPAVVDCVPAQVDGTPWSDSFDSYVTGTGIIGQGAWEGWDNVGPDAFVDSGQSHRGENSLKLAEGFDSNIVRRFCDVTLDDLDNVSTVVVTAWLFIPSTMAGDAYLNLLDTYEPNGPKNLSAQFHFRSDGSVEEEIHGLASGFYSFDQWMEITCEINLNDNTQQILLDQQFLGTSEFFPWSPTGNATLEAINLAAQEAGDFWYDDVGIEFGGAPPLQFIRGDADGNGQFNGLNDALLLLNFGFVPGSVGPPCEAAADADGNRVLNPLADALLILSCAFVPGSPCPPAPFPDCGEDPNAVLGCDEPDAVCNP